MKGHENKKNYPIPITDHGHGEKHRHLGPGYLFSSKMNSMRGRKDLFSRILGGIGKGSEGQTQLQYF
jgi:hypothetical protein